MGPTLQQTKAWEPAMGFPKAFSERGLSEVPKA